MGWGGVGEGLVQQHIQKQMKLLHAKLLDINIKRHLYFDQMPFNVDVLRWYMCKPTQVRTLVSRSQTQLLRVYSKRY